MGISVLSCKRSKIMSNPLVNSEFNHGGRKMQSMRNVQGEDVDMYVPRKCSATSRIIHPTDRCSVQLNIPKVDADGRIVEGEFEQFIAISGFIRNKGRSDQEIEKILISKGLYPCAE